MACLNDSKQISKNVYIPADNSSWKRTFGQGLYIAIFVTIVYSIVAVVMWEKYGDSG